MSVQQAAVHAKWIIGRVIGTKMHKTAKVRVTRLVLNPYLLKYYNKKKTYFAHDALQQCTVGDIVLIKALPEARSKHVKHELAEIVYKVGRVVDPLTGKRVAGTEFMEPLTDLPVSLEETTLTDKLKELNITAASSVRGYVLVSNVSSCGTSPVSGCSSSQTTKLTAAFREKMATRVLQRVGNGLKQTKNGLPANGQVTFVVRSLSGFREDSWFKSLFVRKVDPRKDAHSHLLAKKEDNNLYKIQFHNVKPECLDDYNELCEKVLPSIHADPEYPCELVGTWNTWYGEQDQAVHLWRYRGGYPALTEVMNKLRQNKEFMDYRRERGKMLLSRRNQLLLEFSFWNEPVSRAGPNIYELRSYQLRVTLMLTQHMNQLPPTVGCYGLMQCNSPTTYFPLLFLLHLLISARDNDRVGKLLIVAGEYEARAIEIRQQNQEAVGGFFSQIGSLYTVHHLWAYKDLQSREDTRNAAWQREGWDEVVYYTVPLIQHMESRIMIPMKTSPLK
ncbi:hypothetical protein INR49_011367 [Caranx melampygus]|nr:hypothetical protein INR49_011367 [Caranx melampygus]